MLDIEKEQLLNLYHNNKKGWYKIFQNPQYAQSVLHLKEQYPNLIEIREMMYWLDNNLIAFPKCPTCGHDIHTFINPSKGYQKHCSCRCAQLDKGVRDKYKNSCLLKYGVDNGFKLDCIKQTNLERYGVANPFSSEIIKEKIKQTNIERYGVANPQQNKEIKETTQRTLLERYGVNCGCKLKPLHNRSKGEIELYDYISSIYTDAIANDIQVIKPLELDIYIPSINVGVEYDGDYWHSLPKMRKRDILKNNICKLKSINLIRVLESDWLSDKNNVKSIIKEKIKSWVN